MDHFTRDGLRFDVDDRGPGDGEVVIALHGFPADRSCWGGVAARLTGAGLRVLAPDQRGYSPGARPSGRAAYTVDHLGADVLALADAAGAERFHLVGHDWGAAVGWHLAGAHPDRVRTWTAVSVPHPAALVWSLTHSTQALRSWYMLAFQVPRLPELALGAGRGRRLARGLEASGLPPAVAARYGARATEPGALTGPINWYRALPLQRRAPTPPVRVPTAMVWSPGDRYLGRAGVERTATHVDAPYRLVELASGGHWLPELEPDAVAEVVLAVAGAAA